MQVGILTWFWLLPLIGAIFILFLPRRGDSSRLIALLASFSTFILSLAPIFSRLNLSSYPLVEQFNWVNLGAIKISYYLRLDGLSYPLLLLTTFLSFLAIWASWEIKENRKSYYFWILLLETALIGVFIAFDFVLFYLFWEAVLVPMYFIIAHWGGENRKYAAIKFFLYTLAGSVFMFIGGLIGYSQTGTFSFELWTNALPAYTFWLFFLGFAVKVPIFPFHTWLPDAHVEAPTPGSMLLAGVLLKMGGYGFLRFLLPNLGVYYAGYYGFLFLLGLLSLIYGGIMALIQDDFKRIIAYTSVAHMGVVVIGLSSANELGIAGSLFQMVAHGLITGLLFLLVGLFYHRTHTRDIGKLGGIVTQAPLLSWALLLGCFASLGLPGMASFIGEFLVLLGSFKAFGWVVAWAALGIVLNMLVFLRLVSKVVHGPAKEEYAELKDLSWEEALAVYPLLLVAMIIGVLPSFVLKISGTLYEIFVEGRFLS